MGIDANLGVFLLEHISSLKLFKILSLLCKILPCVYFLKQAQ